MRANRSSHINGHERHTPAVYYQLGTAAADAPFASEAAASALAEAAAAATAKVGLSCPAVLARAIARRTTAALCSYAAGPASSSSGTNWRNTGSVRTR